MDGVVGAVIDGVQCDAFAGEFGAHPGHERFEIGKCIKTASDSGLVGDDDELVVQALGGAAKIKDAGNEPDVLRTVEVADFLVDDAVAVKEESFEHNLSLTQRIVLPDGPAAGEAFTA
jgi:hypothetical protein